MTIKNILEEFGDYLEKNNDKKFYFINPTLKEIEQLKTDRIRFFVDYTDNKVYVFDGYHYTHLEFANKINKNYLYHLLKERKGFSGVAIKKGDKWVMSGSDEILQALKGFREIGKKNKDYLLSLLKNKWYDKYVHCSSYISRLVLPFNKGKPSNKETEEFEDDD